MSTTNIKFNTIFLNFCKQVLDKRIWREKCKIIIFYTIFNYLHALLNKLEKHSNNNINLVRKRTDVLSLNLLSPCTNGPNPTLYHKRPLERFIPRSARPPELSGS
jgi:hypothetical protein